MKKIALISSVAEPDREYITTLLLSKDFGQGTKHASLSFNTDRIDHLYQAPHSEHKHLFLHYGDLSDDKTSSNNIINQFEKGFGLSTIKLIVTFLIEKLIKMKYLKVSYK